jgi:hypothetical protein
MLPYIVGAVGLLILAKKPVASSGPAMGTLAQSTKHPASASAPRSDQGASANQPWYQGPKVGSPGVATPNPWSNPNTYVAGAQALTSLASTFSDIFMSNQPDSLELPDAVSPEDAVNDYDVDDNYSLDTQADTDEYDVEEYYDYEGVS